MTVSLGYRAGLLSLTLLTLFLLAWHVAVRSGGPVQQMDPEYAKLVGLTASQGKSGQWLHGLPKRAPLRLHFGGAKLELADHLAHAPLHPGRA